MITPGGFMQSAMPSSYMTTFYLVTVSAGWTTYIRTPIASDYDFVVTTPPTACVSNVFKASAGYYNTYLEQSLNLPDIFRAPLVASTNYCIIMTNPLLTFPSFSPSVYTSTAAFGNGLLVPTPARGTLTLNNDGTCVAAPASVGAYFA